MEVHHHPHVEKKNSKEYFLEFLMIFLAVTLGFFAENIREYFVDKEHEKQYINSFYEDLSSDEKELPQLISSIQNQQLQAADSLPLLFKNADTKSPANAIYYFLRGMVRQQGIRVFIDDRTISQVKNSGVMRLITNKQISNSLIDYYKQVEFVEYLQQFLGGMKGRLSEKIPPLLNSEDYAKVCDSSDQLIIPLEKLHLRSVNPETINEVLLTISNIKGLSAGVKNMIIKIKNEAGTIKKLIAEKYDLEK